MIRLQIFLTLALAGMSFGEMKLKDYQWKHRILVVAEAEAELIEELGGETEGLVERDLRVFVLSGEGRVEYPVYPNLRKELEARLKPEEGKAEVWLIGKDGRTTLNWARKDFTLKKLFAAIDAMPMRRKEMEGD